MIFMNLIRKSLLFCVCFISLAFMVLADSSPSITDISVRQRWPWSRLVDIDYVLNCDAATQRVDIAVSASDGSMPLSLPLSSLSGDLYNVAPGQRRIVWDPTLSAYTNNILTRFTVDLVATENPPLYMIIDLTKGAGASGQIQYLSEPDLVSGAYGSVATNAVIGINSIAWTGVTNNPAYKDTHLVLRRIFPGSVTTESSTTITVNKSYYIAVFEITQNQWKQIIGSYPACKFSSDRNNPVETAANYNILRGSIAEGIDWPSTGNQVGSNSFMAKIRTRTGIATFDLPDNSQWEYACRAGSTTLYHDNDPTATTNQNNLKDIANYNKGNGGFTVSVGSFLPNAWGLYDMHGNVQEWSLNMHSDDNRTRRGGSFVYGGDRCTSSFSSAAVPFDTDIFGINGFRPVIVLE